MYSSTKLAFSSKILVESFNPHLIGTKQINLPVYHIMGLHRLFYALKMQQAYFIAVYVSKCKRLISKLDSNPNMKVHIGTDSQYNRKKRTIHFVSIIAFRWGLNGASFIKNESKHKCKISVTEKLWNEVYMTMDISELLIEAGIPLDKIVIEFDLNPNPEYKSSFLVNSAVGWAKGVGHQVITKHDTLPQIAVKAANGLC